MAMIFVLAYAVYSFQIVTLSVTDHFNKIYYLYSAALDMCAGFFLLIYALRDHKRSSELIAFIALASVFVHLGGRLLYGMGCPKIYYSVACQLVMSAQVLLMLVRTLNVERILSPNKRAASMGASDSNGSRGDISLQAKEGGSRA